MANTAAHLVDRVLPDVPLRQYVLSLPFELRRLAAFKAPVLGALARIFIEAIFARHRAWAKREGLVDVQSGAVTCVQRFGSSINLNVHFHVLCLDGVFTRGDAGPTLFHPAPPPTPVELEAIVRRVARRAHAWLVRRNLLDERPLEERSNEAPSNGALDACAAIAMQRGAVRALRDNVDVDSEENGVTLDAPRATGGAVEHAGFNLEAGVRIETGDDMGRERLCRYGARPPLALDRLRWLPGGRIAYRIKKWRDGRAKSRVMTPIEFLARLSALVAPPRHPLVRYHGVLAPKSGWRKDVVPRPPRTDEGPMPSDPQCVTSDASKENDACRGGTPAAHRAAAPSPPSPSSRAPEDTRSPVASPDADGSAPALRVVGDCVVRTSPRVTVVPTAVFATSVAPNVLSVRHWERLLHGQLYAATPRIDWATLLRRTFDVDVLRCPSCEGRLRVLGSVTEPAMVRLVLDCLGMPSEPPRVARARDPTELEGELDVE